MGPCHLLFSGRVFGSVQLTDWPFHLYRLSDCRLVPTASMPEEVFVQLSASARYVLLRGAQNVLYVCSKVSRIFGSGAHFSNELSPDQTGS